MSTNVYVLTLSLVLGTVLIVFVMRYVSATIQAKARLAHEDTFRQIAEKAAAAQVETASALAEIRSRLAAVEGILKTVE
ncbi:MAG: hypothetical protein CGW95_02405 [Phenylobacterium zucineum]|nr:MAG: hypothetical protein CGW95_02405 [Phenylobacterium zucineum]